MNFPNYPKHVWLMNEMPFGHWKLFLVKPSSNCRLNIDHLDQKSLMIRLSVLATDTEVLKEGKDSIIRLFKLVYGIIEKDVFLNIWSTIRSNEKKAVLELFGSKQDFSVDTSMLRDARFMVFFPVFFLTFRNLPKLLLDDLVSLHRLYIYLPCQGHNLWMMSKVWQNMSRNCRCTLDIRPITVAVEPQLLLQSQKI